MENTPQPYDPLSPAPIRDNPYAAAEPDSDAELGKTESSDDSDSVETIEYPDASYPSVGSESQAARELPPPIPDILSQLERIESIHRHKYDDGITIRDEVNKLAGMDLDSMSSEQSQLLHDRDVMKSYTKSGLYEFVYSPTELHMLVTRLESFSAKNRPDFDQLEYEIIDIIIRKMSSFGGTVPTDIKRFASKSQEDNPRRRGMQWANLVKFASLASEVIRERMTRSEERADYLIRIKDPNPTNVYDLTAVYQFIADSNTYSVLAERDKLASRSRKEAFIANCELIESWYADVQPILDKLPFSIKVDFRYNKIMPTQGRVLNEAADGMAKGRQVPAAYQVQKLVETMRRRLVSDKSTGKDKNYKYDTAGAISLQKKIGHVIREINQQLLEARTPRIDEEEIVPLEPTE
ncbi:hypothetical protein EXS66_00505 [Candidatus Saccharibacteria bacterium]|nr:hypothetical protein [Candidatus Saccharibacteria bacterium]